MLPPDPNRTARVRRLWAAGFVSLYPGDRFVDAYLRLIGC